MPYDERDPAQVRTHTVSVRHQQFWGRYRVLPGRDSVQGDTVEPVSDSRARRTFHVPFGRLYLTTDEPRLLVNNNQVIKSNYQQRL